MAIRSNGMARSLLFSLFSLGILLPFINMTLIQLDIESDTDYGYWAGFYDTLFPLSIDGQQFIYGQSRDEMNWFIQKLLPDGSLGSETDHDIWSRYYECQFPFSIDGRQFIYGHSSQGSYWFIQEIFPGGIMGRETDSGSWSRFYHTHFPFSINGRQFFYAQSTLGNYWFIQELLPGGRMGSETSSGNWERDYSPQFPFAINGQQFVYAQSSTDNHWFINELLPDGRMGSETDSGYLSEYYPVQFPFAVNGHQFFYASDPGNKCLIYKLLPGGKIGDESHLGHMRHHYRFGFFMGDRSFLFAHSTTDNNPNWSIEEVSLCLSGQVLERRHFGDFKLASWNMQGATCLGETKWTLLVAREMRRSSQHLNIDVFALQESGALPSSTVTLANQAPVTRIDPVDDNNIELTQNIWRLPTNEDPEIIYIYHVEIGRRNNSVSMAIASRRRAHSVFIGGPYNGASRPVIGIQIGNDYFFNIHGGAHPNNEAPYSVRGIEEFMSGQLRDNPETTWVIMGDYNRNPGNLGLLNAPENVNRGFAIPSRPIHFGRQDRTLDYAVTGAGFENQRRLVPTTTTRTLSDHVVVLYLALQYQPVRSCRRG